MRLRYLSHLARWAHSFTRLWTLLRAALWEKYDLHKLLERYGTAGGDFRPKLLHQLKGDLDWIAMKCLEKDLQTWIPLQTNMLGSGPFHFSDPQSPANVRRFYRVQLLP